MTERRYDYFDDGSAAGGGASSKPTIRLLWICIIQRITR